LSSSSWFVTNNTAYLGHLRQTYSPRPKDDPIKAAKASEVRRAQDTSKDEHRKPGEVLPGMTIVDLSSGGGYYTDILTRVVGKEAAVLGFPDNLGI
jgi:predicted methyltransferase